MGFDLGSISASIGVNTAKLDQGLMTAELKLRNFDKSISSFGQKLTAQSTHLMVAGGLMAGSVLAVGVAAVKMASEFETSMRNVNSISKLSETEFKALGESVVGISKKFPQTAKELADGLYDIASSGFQGAAGLKVLEASASAASAGLTNTATSAKGITAVLNAYSLSADDAAGISDTMFRTVDKGVISFEELSGQIGEVVGTANIAGIGFNELSGMIAYMTTKGINAAEATTALNRMMLSIITPTEELAAVLKNAGYESGQMALEQIGLTGVMELIEKAANGDVAAINAMSGDMRAFKAVASLTGSGIEELNKFMGDFKDTTGATSVALKEQSKSLEYQLKLLKNSATAIGIEIGNTLLPSITKYITAAGGMTAANTKLIASNIILAGEMVGVVGGVLLLAGAFGKLRMAVLANPVMAVIAGFVALNGVVDLGAGKLEEMNNVWATTGSVLLRAIAPLTELKKGYSDYITVNKALLDGTIKLSDIKNLNIFTMQKELEKIKELRAEKEKETQADKEKLEVDKEALIAASKSLSINELATEKMAAHAQTQRDLKAATEGTTDAIGNLTLKSLIAQVETAKDKETLDKLKEQYGWNEEEAYSYAKATGLLTDNIKAQKEEIEALCTALYSEYLASTAIDELLAKSNKDYAEYLKNLNANTVGSKANQEQIEATAASLKKWVSEDLQPLAETWLPKLLEKTGSWTAAEYAQAVSIQENIDKAHQLGVDVPAVYDTITAKIVDAIYNQWQPALSAGINRLNDLDKQAGLTGSGIWTALSTAADPIYSSFNPALSAGINRLIELDKTKCQPVISVDTSGAIRGINDVAARLRDLDGRSSSTFIYEYKIKKYDMGGIVGYASGGVVMPQAATGMVVPQTGRAIPILAHEGEMILNDSQQGNLINALWGVANGKNTVSKSSSNEVILHNVINLDGKVLWESNEKYDIRAAGVRV